MLCLEERADYPAHEYEYTAQEMNRIRKLNDEFRQQQTPLGVLTGTVKRDPSLRALPWLKQWQILDAVRRFDPEDFDYDVDGANGYEHASGVVMINGYYGWFHIHYLDSSGSGPSIDPSDTTHALRRQYVGAISWDDADD